MAGHVSNVQKRIRFKNQKAVFIHCASHRLNLVLNELNSIPLIRNTIGIIKGTIHFFKESSIRQAITPNFTKLCITNGQSDIKL